MQRSILKPASPFASFLNVLIPVVVLSVTLAACGGDGDAGDVPAAVEDTAVVEAAPPRPAPGTKINLNTAGEDDFRTIPGVGDRMVQEFMEYRPYVSIQQFRQEIGKYVDAEQVAAYEQYVYVPIDPDESDAATLQQLPGLTADEAADLVAARPFGSNETFLDRLSAYVDSTEWAEAEALLDAL